MSNHEPRVGSASVSWDPVQYEKFSSHRLRSALELLARIPLNSPETIVDLGCGPGSVTRLIAERWPHARIWGVDNSKDMLAQAQSDASGIRWELADIADWTPPQAPDLIYSNATLHWLTNHRRLLTRLIDYLQVGGCLAVQMPLSWDLPSHRLMRETLADGGRGGQALGAAKLRKSLAQSSVQDAEFYYSVLRDRARSIDIWETEYLHVLEGGDAVFEWVQGTGLRPVLDALEGSEQETFVTVYRRRLRDVYPISPDGKTLYRFRRLFLVAVK